MTQDSNVENDLQKAIDDITNDTNTDPVFSDPVAAPSSVPEGDTGELGEPIGPFPEPKFEMANPMPEPIAPIDPANVPDLSNMPTPGTTTFTTVESESFTPPMPEPQAAPTPEPQIQPTTSNASLTMRQVKEAALRDLVPLLDNLNMSPSQKFNIYRNVFEELRDYTVLERVYRAASEIENDTERAEALLYLVESIDKM